MKDLIYKLFVFTWNFLWKLKQILRLLYLLFLNQHLLESQTAIVFRGRGRWNNVIVSNGRGRVKVLKTQSLSDEVFDRPYRSRHFKEPR